VALVRWTFESQRWLREISDYIKDQGYPDRAPNVILKLIERGGSLSSMPERGSIYLNRDGKDIRVIYYGHYRIAYWVNADTVFILGIFNGRMQLENYIKIVME